MALFQQVKGKENSEFEPQRQYWKSKLSLMQGLDKYI